MFYSFMGPSFFVEVLWMCEWSAHHIMREEERHPQGAGAPLGCCPLPLYKHGWSTYLMLAHS
jgi:hypothetical protein